MTAGGRPWAESYIPADFAKALTARRVTQAATVHELFEADTAASRWQLFGRAMNVGRSHIAATVNTLVLAYVGASLPLIGLIGRRIPFVGEGTGTPHAPGWD